MATVERLNKRGSLYPLLIPIPKDLKAYTVVSPRSIPRT